MGCCRSCLSYLSLLSTLGLGIPLSCSTRRCRYNRKLGIWLGSLPMKIGAIANDRLTLLRPLFSLVTRLWPLHVFSFSSEPARIALRDDRRASKVRGGWGENLKELDVAYWIGGIGLPPSSTSKTEYLVSGFKSRTKRSSAFMLYNSPTAALCLRIFTSSQHRDRPTSPYK